MANMTFKTNLLPNSDLEYSLGSASNPTARWKIYGEVQPLMSKTYSAYTCSADNEAKGVLFFGKVNITNSIWYAPWLIHYRLSVSTTEGATQGQYDCYYSVCGSTVNYYIYNNFYSTSYRPIYNHRLLYPKDGYNSYGGYIGVRVQSARSTTTLARTFTIEILETQNCTVELNDSIKRFDETYITTNSIAASTIWYNTDFNGTSQGLQETGDIGNDTGYYILTNGFRGTADTTYKLWRYCLFARSGNNIYESFTSTSGTATNKTKNPHGFLPEGKIYWNSASGSDYSGTISFSPYQQYHSIDYRYTFNIGTSDIPANVNTYLKWTYNDEDGLLYLADSWLATALPTTEDGFIYQRIGSNYYGSADYRASLLLDNPYYIYKNSSIQVWIPPQNTVVTTGNGNAVTDVSISGSTITVTKGASYNNYTYTLPTASSSTKGGIKVGTGLSVSSDTLSVSTTSGTSTLAWNSEVTLGTVGGLAIKAKLPDNPNSNTWRPIQVNGAAALSDSTTTLNLKAGSNVSISNSSGTVTIAATDTTYSSLAATSGGTAVSLVTTGEKYTWNSKTSNTGTVTKVSTGVGLTGGDITGTGTIKAKLKTETAFTADSAAQTNTANRQYMVGVDKSGYLSVNVPWTDNNTWTAMTGATSSANGTVGYVNAAPPKDGYNTKYLRADGTWAVPPDNNTWRGIQDNLTSDSATDSLSAKQGKALANGSARDNTKLPLAGGTMTGAIKRYYDAASTDPVLSITSNDKDVTLFNIGHGTAAGTPSSCWYRLVYKGTGTSPNNTLQLIAAKSTVELTAVEINEDGMITFNGTGIFKKTTDAAGTANNSPALIIGGTATQAHIEIDANEIMAKANGTTTATLYLNNDGGEVQIGGKVAVRVTSAPTSGQVMIADGTGGLIKSSGYTIAKSVPSDAVFTDTDTKQNITLATTSKAFITGVTTTPTSTAQALTGVADTGVYLTATAGEVSAVRHSFNSSGTEKAYITYNTTTNALDFVFV